MNRKKISLIICAVLLAALLGGGVVYAKTAAAGSREDPLVTLSYLEEVFRGEVSGFSKVTLSRGQRLEGGRGCQVMLRIGSCAADGSDEPVLVDTTDAREVSDGSALVKNHLYMITIPGNGVVASENNTVLLVSGTYTVG